MSGVYVPRVVVGELCTRAGLSGEQAQAHVGRFDSLLELLHASPDPAVHGTDLGVAEPLRAPATHAELRRIIADGAAERALALGLAPGVRVALALRTGPEAAVALVTVMASACAVPLNAAASVEELRREMETTRCSVLIVDADTDPARLAELAAAAAGVGAAVGLLVPNPSTCGLFTLAACAGAQRRAHPQHAPAGSLLNGPDDTVLVLQTSGSTGAKKLVPYSLRSAVTSAVLLAAAGQLAATDVGLCCMPLFHAGGIFRMLLAPLLSGGSVVYAPYFEAGLFWELAAAKHCTWYYAAPTMHMAILDAVRAFPVPLQHGIRYIVNAAGPLPPLVAAQLLDIFPGADVAPCYGMTECMPISAPPPGWRLDKPGSCGRPLGPQVSIRDARGAPLPPGVPGRICIRGCPVFEGYERKDGSLSRSAFDADGWFDTGDLGYLDQDGHLFISGRSKEVINRGGETIAPAEIEDALLSHPGVRSLAAFSAPHAQLQECVGVAVVPRDPLQLPTLGSLRKHAAGCLHPSKWPDVVVYMEALPRGPTGKLVRLCMAQRMALAPVDATPGPRHFSAPTAPLAGDITSPIPIVPIESLDAAAATAAADGGGGAPVRAVPRSGTEQAVAAIFAAALGIPVESVGGDADFFEALGGSSLLAGRVSSMARRDLGAACTGLTLFQHRTVIALAAHIEELCRQQQQQRWQLRRQQRWRRRARAAAGGTDELAEPLLGSESEEEGEGVGGADDSAYFMMPGTSKGADAAAGDGGGFDSGFGDGKEGALPPPASPTAPLTLLVQALPVLLIPPLRRATFLSAFLGIWMALMRAFHAAKHGGGPLHAARAATARLLGAAAPAGWHTAPVVLDRAALLALRVTVPGPLQLGLFLLAIQLAVLACAVGFPLLGVAAKWVLVGRLRAGRYRLWGVYYLRWWLADRAVSLCGRGVFAWTPGLLRLYLRLLGAHVGARAVVSPAARLGEWDLLWIGEDAAVDARAYLRPMAAHGGALLLAPIRLGAGAAMCVGSIAAPGAVLAPGAALAPNASSREPAGDSRAARAACRAAFPQPPLVWLAFVGAPLVMAARLLSYMPVLVLLVAAHHAVLTPVYSAVPFMYWQQALSWLLEPAKVGVYLAGATAYALFTPWLRLGAAIAIKRSIIGPFRPGPRGTSGWQLTRHWLMDALLPGGGLAGFTTLVGTHWEAVSMVYRLLGAKVGKRVFWPGSGISITEPDLIEIGDDVVFGSRSTFIPMDAAHGACIVLGAGCNIADRCVLLPGACVDVNACAGSGAVVPRGGRLPPGSVWVGCRGAEGAAVQLEPGCRSAAEVSTIKPFGAAQYLRRVQYWLPSPWGWALIASAFTMTAAVSRRAESIACLLLARELGGAGAAVGGMPLLAFYARCMAAAFISVKALALGARAAAVMGAKWGIVGQRTPGPHPWTSSPYCTRWNVLLMAQKLLSTRLLATLGGSQWLVWYYRALGAKIGSRACIFPTGSDPMFTEPDLVEIGDCACINYAYVLAHTNSRGAFTLERVRVGAGATMRSHARLMAGAVLGDGAVMAEHTLAMPGEEVAPHSEWRGWPVEEVRLLPGTKTGDV